MDQIKVLWFSNTSANADEYYNKTLVGTGGWLKSLDKELQTEVQLSVAFFSENNIPFKYQGTSYFPIESRETLFFKILRKLFNYERQVNYLQDYLKIIGDVKPDIIHIHGTELTFGEIIGHVAIPVAVSIQGNITVYRYKYFSGIEKRYSKFLLEKKHLIRSLFFGNFFQSKYKYFTIHSQNEQRYLAKTRHIIGRTDWDRRITSILSPGSDYFHCDEMLRDSFYKNEWSSRNNRIPIIHTTAANSFYKGIETVCHALSLLNNMGLQVEWRVAGVNENDLILHSVKRKLHKNYPERGLIFLGNLSESQLVQKLLEADIFVMPSHIENSPNNLCEAMILGLPCIATFSGGTGSLLQDQSEGILIQDGDAWAMAGAVAELLHNKQRASDYGKKARIRAMHRHNRQRIVSELVDNYKKIIGS
jgi:glycosyltransferase involved in cell wall biosynthesis